MITFIKAVEPGYFWFWDAGVQTFEKTINCVHAEYQNDSRISARTYMYMIRGGVGGVASRLAAKVIREYNNNNNVRCDIYT